MGVLAGVAAAKVGLQLGIRRERALPVGAFSCLEKSVDSGCGEAGEDGLEVYKHGHDSAAVEPVLLRGDIAYDRARILRFRLDKMHDDEVLFHFDTVARHNSTAIKHGNRRCIAAWTLGCGVWKWLHH